MRKYRRRQFIKNAAVSAGAVSLTRLSSGRPGREIFSISGAAQFSIFRPPEVDEVTEFATEELQKYLLRVSSIELNIAASNELRGFSILVAPATKVLPDLNPITDATEDLPEDSFIVHSGKDFIAISGRNSRGSLYGVYGFLEALGCRFYGLGESGEVVPKMNPIAVPQVDIVMKPAFRWRDWSEDSTYAHRNRNPEHEQRHERFWLELIDWFGKNRINMTGNEDYPSMAPEFRKRGIERWTGGHLIPGLLPRELFDKHPEYFRMDPTGKRVVDGNFCPSSIEALRIVAANAVEYLKQRPYSANLQVWGEDVWDGSWCYCPKCGSMTAQDQYLTTCNAIARAVSAAGYKIDVDAIAYHDSIEPDITVKPDPNLKMMWAPRERSYGHALNDMRSERNQWYVDCFERWAAIFGPRNMNLFEYYTDNILFRSFPVSCPHLIARDVQYYTDVGLNNHYLVCHLGDYAFQAEPLGCLAYARMIYNRNQDIDEVIADYCQTMYGPAASTMHRWHDQFEKAMGYCATFGDVQRVPTDSGPRSEKLISEVKGSLESLNRTNLMVKRARSETSDPIQRARIDTQSWVNEFAVLMVKGLLHQIVAEYHFARINTLEWSRRGAGRKPHDGLEGRYTLALEEFRKAVQNYESATAFYQSLPVRENSVWCDSDLLRHNRNVCNEMVAKIEECEKHL